MDSIELTAHDKDFIQKQMESGGYQSASEVISAGLRMLEDQESLSEKWLREEISSRMDELDHDPKQAVPVETVFANLEARHKIRLAKEN